METADVLTMILFGLIVAACWIVVPGLIAGWMLRESGRSFRWGFALGAVCGPLGVFVALVFVFFAARGTEHARHRSSASPRRHDPRAHYEVPILGRLHTSTAWTLAGLATFMCVWVLGGISFEIFYNLPREAEQRRAPGSNSQTAIRQDVSPEVTQAEAASSDKETAADAKNDAPASQRALMLGAVTSQPTQPGQSSVGASPATPRPAQASSLEGVTLTGIAPSPQPSAPAQANTAGASQGNVAAPPPKPPVEGRAAIISELTSSLSARGYKAHATISGDARTSTLSISCATLTRAAGNQLLGNSRTRASLKAAGIRIVVMINGQESWTYML